jgi:hypothetical protein
MRAAFAWTLRAQGTMLGARGDTDGTKTVSIKKKKKKKRRRRRTSSRVVVVLLLLLRRRRRRTCCGLWRTGGRRVPVLGSFIIAVHRAFVLGLGARHRGIVELSEGVIRCVTVFACYSSFFFLSISSERK